MLSRRGGFILVVVCGILGLLVLLCVALVGTATAAARGSSAAAREAQERLAAGSGMDYGAVRLLHERGGYPLQATAAWMRGEDRRCIDPPGVPLAGLRNPSYDHGERWADSVGLSGDGLDNDGDAAVDEAGEGEGLFTSGEAWSDLDGDGNRGGWTGRLRGGKGQHGLPFLLRIASVGAGVPVNAGSLDSPYQLGLSHVLNNLGVVCGIATRRQDLQTGPGGAGEAIRTSRLGEDLIRSRPPLGYRSEAAVRGALLSLGYASWECERVLPFLSVGPYDAGTLMRGGTYGHAGGFEGYVPIELATARREVLLSLWMYLAATPPYETLPGDPCAPPAPSSWAQAAYSRTGGALSFDELREAAVGRRRSPQRFALFPDEAAGVVDVAAALRAEIRYSWNAFYQRLADQAVLIFAKDANDLAAFPLAAQSWTQAKADLAFHSVSFDPYPHAGEEVEVPAGSAGTVKVLGEDDPLASWCSWGVSRPAGAARPFWGTSFRRIGRVPLPALGAGWAAPWAAFTSVERISPQGLTMAPPGVFRVESACGGAEEGGTLVVDERLDVTSQRDFDHGARRPGISVKPDIPLADRRDTRPDGAHPYPHVSTHPVLPTQVEVGGVVEALSEAFGAVSIARRETGPEGADRYWPFTELGPAVAVSGASYPIPPPAPALDVAADGSCTPFEIAASTAPFPPSDLPAKLGLSSSPAFGGEVIEEMTLSFLAGPASSVGIVQLPSSLRLSTSRCETPSGRRGTRFTCRIAWPFPTVSEHSCVLEDPSPSWGPWIYRCGLVLRRVQVPSADDPAEEVGKTEVRLWVEGSEVLSFLHDGMDPDLNPTEQKEEGELSLSSLPMSLRFKGADEVRAYKAALMPPPAPSGSLADKGLYRSPLYIPEGGARLGLAQWSGIRPSGLPSGFDKRSHVLKVRLLAYPDPDGAGAPTVYPLAEPSGEVADLGDASCGSFRFEADFDTPGMASAWREPPVLESLWITYRRPGRGWLSRTRN